MDWFYLCLKQEKTSPKLQGGLEVSTCPPLRARIPWLTWPLVSGWALEPRWGGLLPGAREEETRGPLCLQSS